VEAGRVIGGEGTRYQSAMAQGSVIPVPWVVHVERATNTARDRLQLFGVAHRSTDRALTSDSNLNTWLAL
jgi:hypothetical protein